MPVWLELKLYDVGVQSEGSIELLVTIGADSGRQELDVVTTGVWIVFERELNKLESPAPAAVMIEGVDGGFGCVDEPVVGSFFDFFGDGVKTES